MPEEQRRTVSAEAGVKDHHNDWLDLSRVLIFGGLEVLGQYLINIYANSAPAAIKTFLVPITAAVVCGILWLTWKGPLRLKIRMTGVVGVVIIVSFFMALLGLPGVPGHPTAASSNPYPPHKGTLVMNAVQTSKTTPQARYLWQTDSDATGKCSLEGANYHVAAISQSEVHFCGIQNTNVRDFTFETNVAFLAPGEAGMILRAATIDGQLTFYDLALESYGYVYLYVSTPAGAGKKVGESGVPPEDFDRTPGNVNTLAVTMDGSTIDVYVNHVQVIHAIDDTNDRGSLQVYAAVPHGENEPRTEAVFSAPRLWVW